ncbi:MAG: DUF3795 domain-containing protein [Anaerolineaceae bacterium]|nr:DUF3795 domain-containing protein [Anaerolineaceae bacterium]
MSQMYQNVAYCGLVCEGCPMYWPTYQPDPVKKQKMRAEVLRITHDLWGMEMKIEEITDCRGCKSPDDQVFKGCLECAIRSCARGKGYQTCAECADFPCNELEQFFTNGGPQTRALLETIRAGL